MSTIVELEEAKVSLKDLIAHMGPNDEVIITENSEPVARLVPPPKTRPQFGGCEGMLTIVSDDDEHLEDFKDDMP